jgi:hypothetical protein
LLGAFRQHAAQLLVGYLLADQVEGQARGTNAAGTLEQRTGLNLGRELRPAREDRRDIGDACGGGQLLQRTRDAEPPPTETGVLGLL